MLFGLASHYFPSVHRALIFVSMKTDLLIFLACGQHYCYCCCYCYWFSPFLTVFAILQSQCYYFLPFFCWWRCTMIWLRCNLCLFVLHLIKQIHISVYIFISSSSSACLLFFISFLQKKRDVILQWREMLSFRLYLVAGFARIIAKGKGT